ncbi:MAG: hypothetical protein H6760_04990 [Candidatus Nomurabacteria bacterium]|nr:MAG: hypothetical protein H6760_04990 [Candidatus Nomurabacteria bacterium]
MEEKHRDVHGHKVFYAEEAKRGVEYLDNALDYKEAEVFFRDAKSHGESEFEDEDRRNFTLVYNKNGTYTLVYRKESRGWF